MQITGIVLLVGLSIILFEVFPEKSVWSIPEILTLIGRTSSCCRDAQTAMNALLIDVPADPVMT